MSALNKYKKILLFLSVVSIFSSPLYTQIEFRSAHIVCKINTELPATDKSRILELGDVSILYLVVEAKIHPMFSSIYISDLDSVCINDVTIPASRVKPWYFFDQSDPIIRWYRIGPEHSDTAYVNNFNSLFPWAEVKYSENSIPEWNDRWSVSPGNSGSDESKLSGTVRYKAEIAFNGQFASTPGIESRYRVISGDYGGLSNDVFRLSQKSKSKNHFISNLMVFLNIPYIENASSWCNTWSDHQTVEWIGGNLWTFTIRAAEIAGRNLHRNINKSPLPESNLFQLTDYYFRKVYLSNGYYLTQEGKRIPLHKHIFHEGDFIMKGNKFVILYEDRSPLFSNEGNSPNEYLDEADLVIQANRRSMNIATLGKSLGDSLSLIYWQERW